ncbi:DUF1631 family protein [Andreprevotia chitinilytica]|uniref:DUF1631 family protein n=1 Tax=Andreprevotia chitinilytica TaxID=396808 RepID=UPI0005594A43|nr:DUF1631 family protein [Andreprevotia chitinilytica]
MQSVRHTPKAKQPSPTLLACRDLALRLLTESLDGFFTQLEETYFKLAESSVEKDLRDSYFQARIEAKTRKEEIINAFREQFLNAFNERVQNGNDPSVAKAQFKAAVEADKLSLVANDEYEENLTVSNVASALTQRGGDTLSQLEQRLATLMPSSQASESENNPLSPKAICEAFLGAFQQLESGLGARLVALRTLETELSEQVASVYQHINQYLIQQNIQPVARGVQRRPSSRPASAPNAPASPQQGGEQGVAGQASYGGGDAGQYGGPQYSGMPGGQQGGPQFGSPQFAEQFANAGYPGGMPTSGFPMGGGVPGGGNQHYLSVDQTALAGFLEQLTQATAEPQRLVRPVWFNVLDQLQQDPPTPQNRAAGAGPENLLTLLRASRWAGELNRVDTMTLELVAMLFDRLFEDDRLTIAAKGLLARLQIPVLKCALLDAGFFGNKSHPARVLIDFLADACLAWEDEPTTDDPTFNKYNDIIAWVSTHYADDISVFETALQELERFAEHEGKRAEQKITSEAQALLEREVQELAAATASALIQSRLSTQFAAGALSAPVVNDFIQQRWQIALVAAYGPAGEAEPVFAKRVAAMDMLLWSIQPKRGAEERLRLVNELPAMLKALEEGAQAAGMDKPSAQSFFAELVQLHAGAIRNGMKIGPAVDTTPAFTPPPAIPVEPPKAIRDAITAAEDNEDMTIPVVTSVVTDARPAEDDDGLPTRGEWLEWQGDDGEFRRHRLSWISPQKTRYLLTNRGGENGLGFTREELIKHLDNGRLRRLSGAFGVTEQALGQLRAHLSH